KSGNGLKLYINGQLDSEAALDGKSISNDGPLYLGKDPWYSGIVGDLDDIRIYHGALSPEIVAALSRQEPVTNELAWPLSLTDQLSQAELSQRRKVCENLLRRYSGQLFVLDPRAAILLPPGNDEVRPDAPTYLKEVFYFIPMQLALQLQR